MKKIVYVLMTSLMVIVSCKKESSQTESSFIKCEVSACMPSFVDGGEVETKATIQSVVKIQWEAGDQLVVINLTTGKQLGGCLVADDSAEKTTFTPLNLKGEVNAGDKLVLFLDTMNSLVVENEQDYSPIEVNLSEQDGGSDNVPIVAYADYTATEDNVITAVDLSFHFMVSYIQLALSALPAGTTISAFEVNGVNSRCQFNIDEGEFVMVKTKGKVKLIDPFNANAKGANVRYFSIFATSAEVSARQATITANGQEHSTAWIKAAMNAGYYYQSVATGFANENIQFVDPSFKAYCVSHYDVSNDGELSFAEAAAITTFEPFTNAEKSAIESVYELPYFPKALGLMSFEGCSELKTILIPSTITAIPDNCFKGCSSLVDITIPESVESIGECAFEGCSSLQYFAGHFSTTDHHYLVKNEDLLAYAPSGCDNVVIPDAVRTIKKSVFKSCDNIKSLQLSSVSSIEDDAFMGCSYISSVNLPYTITSIGDNVFKNCSSLAIAYSQNSTPPAIGNNVFNGCADGFKVLVSEANYSTYSASDWDSYGVYPRDWHKIKYTTTDGNIITPNDGYRVYSKLNIELTLISNTYENGIGELVYSGDIAYCEERNNTSIFTGQERLASIILPDSMERIPNLRNCVNLETINIPESLNLENGFRYSVVEGCNSISQFTGCHTSADGKYVILNGVLIRAASILPEEITITAEVTSIGEYAFGAYYEGGSQTLKIVHINDNVKSIGTQAFRLCKVKEYIFSSLVPPVLTGDYWTFWFGEGGVIKVPEQAVNAYKTAGDNWSYNEAIIIGY